MGLKNSLINKGIDFSLGALGNSLSGGSSGTRTRPAFQGSNVAQNRVLEHELNKSNALFGALMSQLQAPRDLSHLNPSDPGGRVGRMPSRAPTPFNFNGDFSSQPYSGASFANIPGPPNVNAELTPEQLRKMLGG